MNLSRLVRGFAAAVFFVSSGCTQAVDDASTAPVGTETQADQGPNVRGYAFVNADGSINANSTSAAGNPPIRAYAQHFASGAYTVWFPNLGNGLTRHGHQGVAEVSAYGATNGHCELSGVPLSTPISATYVEVDVLCYDQWGARKDTPFIITLDRRADTPGVEGGYLAMTLTMASQSFSTNSTTLAGDMSAWNSTGQDIIHQRYAAGIYLVTFKGQSYSEGGTAQVTAAANLDESGLAKCEVNGYGPYYGDTIAWVLCTDVNGNYTESGYSLSVTRNSPSGLPSFSYALADQATASGTYVPLAAFQKGVHGGECQVSTNRPVTVTPRSGSTGVYDVTFPEMGTFAGSHAVTTVTAYGGYGEHCNVMSQSGIQNGDAYATVACYDTHGIPTPAQFIISFGLDVGIIC